METHPSSLALRRRFAAPAILSQPATSPAYFDLGSRAGLEEVDLRRSERSNLPERASRGPDTAVLAARLSAASTNSTSSFRFFIGHPTSQTA